MFSISFEIDNPLYQSFTQYKYKNLLDYERNITKNKILSFYIEKYNTHLFEFELTVSLSGQDNTCSYINVNIFGLAATLQIFDNRRWDYDKHTWQQ